MGEEQKAPMWVALLAGAVVLGTGPLALALILTLSSSAEGAPSESFVELVRDGGRVSFAVLFAGAFASLAGAILTAVSVRRPALPAPIALIPFLLASLAALLGVIFGMRQVIAVLTSVAPRDSSVILMAAIGELSSLSVQALAFAAAGTICVALAAAVSLGTAPRGARVLTLLGAGALGSCLGVMTAQGLSMREGFRALGSASPGDQLTIFLAIVQQWRELNQLANGLFLATLTIAAVGGAILVARHQRAAGLGAALTLLVAAVGFRGFNAMTERQVSGATAPPSGLLFTLKGVEPSQVRPVELFEDRIDSVDGAVDLRMSLHDVRDGGPLSVELKSWLEPKMLLRVLQIAHLKKASWVELIGEAPHTKLDVPPLFVGAAEVVNHIPSAAPVRVLFPEEVCSECVTATVTESGLQVGAESWTQGEGQLTGELDTLPGVEVAFVEDLEALGRAAVTALAHKHVLVVRVPIPEPLPE